MRQFGKNQDLAITMRTKQSFMDGQKTKEVTANMTDKYNRKINYLRISVTDRCNLKCIYCMPSGVVSRLKHEEILTYEEILRLVRIATELGIDKVRVTGGEPLVRKGIYDFLSELGSIEKITDLSITTNGILLKDNIKKLKTAGIKRLNISLDTLKKNRYEKITGFDGFQNVWEAIFTAQHMGFNPIKINTVVMKGINEDEIADLAKLSINNPFHIRFIEYMPMGTDHVPFHIHYMPNTIIKSRLEKQGDLVSVTRHKGDGPAKRYKFKGAAGEIGFISPISDCFCLTCNRIRLMAAGQIKPCLLSEQHIDIKTALRSNASDEVIAKIFSEAIKSKPVRHNLGTNNPTIVHECMSCIGG